MRNPPAPLNFYSYVTITSNYDQCLRQSERGERRKPGCGLRSVRKCTLSPNHHVSLFAPFLQHQRLDLGLHFFVSDRFISLAFPFVLLAISLPPIVQDKKITMRVRRGHSATQPRPSVWALPDHRNEEAGERCWYYLNRPVEGGEM